VAGIVLSVSEDDGIRGFQARKAALRRQVAAAGDEALVVFAADKVSKARELQSAVGPEGLRGDTRNGRVRMRKLTHYRRSLELLDELLPHSPLVKKLRSELERLGAAEPVAATLAGAA